MTITRGYRKERFMRARILGLLLLGLLPTACVTPPPPYTVNMNGLSVSIGLVDPDVWALNMAQWAFADAGRTANRPVEAARAAAAVEYLAVQLNTFRWDAMDPLIKIEMGQARDELRQTLGIQPNAPSQPVIDALLGFADALARGDRGMADAALRNPFFTLGAEKTLAVLTNLPYMRMVNVATMRAGQVNPNGTMDGASRRWR